MTPEGPGFWGPGRRGQVLHGRQGAVFAPAVAGDLPTETCNAVVVPCPFPPFIIAYSPIRFREQKPYPKFCTWEVLALAGSGVDRASPRAARASATRPPPFRGRGFHRLASRAPAVAGELAYGDLQRCSMSVSSSHNSIRIRVGFDSESKNPTENFARGLTPEWGPLALPAARGRTTQGWVFRVNSFS